MCLNHGSEHPSYQVKQRTGAIWPGDKKALERSYQNIKIPDEVGEVRKRKPDSFQWKVIVYSLSYMPTDWA